ncbi:MAG: AAA family ATPase [Halobacteria archaeon]
MQQGKTAPKGINIEIQNIGGVEHTELTLSKGTNVLTGKNSTNKTSILKAIAGVLGWDGVPLKSDAEEGYATMEIEGTDETYHVELERRDEDGRGVKDEGFVERSGNRYLEEDDKAERFAYLLKDKKPRNIITNPGELYDVIMDPIETEEIEERKSVLRGKVEKLEDRIATLKGERSQEGITSRIQRKKKEKARTRDKIEETESEIDKLEKDLTEIRDRKERERSQKDEEDGETAELREKIEKKRENDLNEVLDRQSELRRKISNIQSRVEKKQRKLEERKKELRVLVSELDDLDDVSRNRLDEIDSRITDLKSRKKSVEKQVREINELIKSNEKLLGGELSEMLKEIHRKEEFDRSTKDDDRANVDALFDDGTQIATNEVVSPVTGFTVDEKLVEEVNEKYRSIRKELNVEKTEVGSELDELTEIRADLIEDRERKDRLENKLLPMKKDVIDEIEERIDGMERKIREKKLEIEDLEADEEAVKDEIMELESRLNEKSREKTEESDIDLESQENELVSTLSRKRDKLSRLEDELADVRDKIEDLRERKAEIPDLEENLQERRADLRSARSIIEDRENEAVEQFNHNMEVLLEMLDYEELESVWLEILHQSSTDRDTEFRMNIVRSTDEGAAYADSVETLSESEEAVVGLMFGLSGYIAHDVASELPFLLIDSLEDLDTDSTYILLNHFVEQTEYLVGALLPKSVEDLPENDFNFITTKGSDQPA